MYDTGSYHIIGDTCGAGDADSKRATEEQPAGENSRGRTGNGKTGNLSGTG